MGESVRLENCQMKVTFCSEKGIMTSLTALDDEQKTEFLLTPEDFPELEDGESGCPGTLNLELERNGKTEFMHTLCSGDIRKCIWDTSSFTVEYNGGSALPSGIKNLKILQQFQMLPEGLRWTIRIKNVDKSRLTIKKLGIPLLMNQYFRGSDTFKYEKCVMRHSCIVGTHSWLYWSKSSGQMPMLLMQTLEDTGLSHFTCCTDTEKAFGRKGTIGKAFEGLFQVFPWHEAVTESHLSCKEKILEAGEETELRFLFTMENSMEELKQRLKALGGIGVSVTPGMCVPKKKVVDLQLDTMRSVKIWPEYTEDTVKILQWESGLVKAELAFGGCGIRKIFVQTEKGCMELQFFAMEEPEQIFEKQAAFIAEKQFETDQEDPCYHGLLMWDMVVKGRINSRCNPHGADWFAGGSDEIGLVSGVFLSEKNVYRPKRRELCVLRDYLKDFVEERLTEQPGNRVHRMVPWFTMQDDWRGNGADDVWRAFNYVHVVNTYFNMYRIQHIYGFDFLEEKIFYLKRAFDYTKAMFSYWMFPDGVGALQYGNMGEMTIALDLEAALRKEGMLEEAEEIKKLADEKARFFSEKEYPFGSEMAYDSTAFEAVYAYGKRMKNQRVMKSSARAALANRGRQPIWYLYNTDLRQMGDSNWNVSYMTQLGAYDFYDWVLEQGNQDLEILRSMYASYLAGFAIYNSEGCWSDAPENEGASAWIIHGEKGRFSGFDQNNQPFLKGCVPMSGESALGYFGALRISCSVMFYDELGKVSGLGCRIKQEGDRVLAEPEDGLRMRWFDLVHGLAVKLERDSICQIVKEKEMHRIWIQNYTKDRHELNFMLRVCRPGIFVIGIERNRKKYQLSDGWNQITVMLPSEGAMIQIEEE